MTLFVEDQPVALRRELTNAERQAISPPMTSSVKSLIKRVARKIAGPGEIATYHHRSDQMATRHNDGFRRNPIFARAYARSVAAADWDYEIPYRVHQALWCADQARKVEGDFVELGTARGFIMSAILESYPDWTTSGRSAWLFDTFESGWVEKAGERGSPSRYYATSFEDVQGNFSEWPRVNLVQGNVFDTLPQQPIERIAFLHIDLNAAEPETFGLRHLWDRLPRGAAILFDDYAYSGRDAQFEAMNALAADLGLSIMSTPTGQGIAIK